MRRFETPARECIHCLKKKRMNPVQCKGVQVVLEAGVDSHADPGFVSSVLRNRLSWIISKWICLSAISMNTARFDPGVKQGRAQSTSVCWLGRSSVLDTWLCCLSQSTGFANRRVTIGATIGICYSLLTSAES
jgi:hypothetical protein